MNDDRWRVGHKLPQMEGAEPISASCNFHRAGEARVQATERREQARSAQFILQALKNYYTDEVVSDSALLSMRKRI